jgi:hypothetical protein
VDAELWIVWLQLAFRFLQRPACRFLQNRVANRAKKSGFLPYTQNEQAHAGKHATMIGRKEKSPKNCNYQILLFGLP